MKTKIKIVLLCLLTYAATIKAEYIDNKMIIDSVIATRLDAIHQGWLDKNTDASVLKSIKNIGQMQRDYLLCVENYLKDLVKAHDYSNFRQFNLKLAHFSNPQIYQNCHRDKVNLEADKALTILSQLEDQLSQGFFESSKTGKTLGDLRKFIQINMQKINALTDYYILKSEQAVKEKYLQEHKMKADRLTNLLGGVSFTERKIEELVLWFSNSITKKGCRTRECLLDAMSWLDAFKENLKREDLAKPFLDKVLSEHQRYKEDIERVLKELAREKRR